jgi:hypothetical protein
MGATNAAILRQTHAGGLAPSGHASGLGQGVFDLAPLVRRHAAPCRWYHQQESNFLVNRINSGFQDILSNALPKVYLKL